MKKGIILFDIQDFMYQGINAPDKERDNINQRQLEAINLLHTKLGAERQRRLASHLPVPTVDLFLPTGDGYYLICAPELPVILDIGHCIMALLHAIGVKANCMGHLGEIFMFTDMTGRENATGFDLCVANRILSLSGKIGKITCSESLLNIWQENAYFDLDNTWCSGTAKDGIKYKWKLALPKQFELAISHFT